VPLGVADAVQELISLVGQLSGQVKDIADDSIDVSSWKIYFSDLDTLYHTWWRLPALYGTGDDLGDITHPSANELSVARESTFNSIESSAGVPWQTIAKVNRISGTAESDTDWAGKTLLIPKTNSFFLPGGAEVVGSQAGARVLGTDLANSLTMTTTILSSEYQTHLNSAISATATDLTAFVVDDASGFPGASDSDAVYTVQIGTELIEISTTDISTHTLTPSRRAVRGTSAAAHSVGTAVDSIPIIDDVAVLDYTDTFIQGLENSLEAVAVQQVMGGEYGAVKGGIVLLTVVDALKSDPRVGSVTNVQSRVEGDKLIISLDVNSIGRLTKYSLQTHYHGV
jgi:hypothetical protein